MHDDRHVIPVAIVGGGPVGMMLALFLDRHGVRTVVFNSEQDVRFHPKGSTHNARTMEHYRRLGFADEVRQFDDLVSGYDTRDDAGLPLGDVYGHALNRLKISYGILEAAKLAGDIWGYGNGDGVPPSFEAYPVGAHPQDRTGWSRQYPAAHVSPCRLAPKSSAVPN